MAFLGASTSSFFSYRPLVRLDSRFCVRLFGSQDRRPDQTTVVVWHLVRVTWSLINNNYNYSRHTSSTFQLDYAFLPQHFWLRPSSQCASSFFGHSRQLAHLACPGWLTTFLLRLLLLLFEISCWTGLDWRISFESQLWNLCAGII